jgi:aromatic-L-amino-acid/L-tryptophan decarboxylase
MLYDAEGCRVVAGSGIGSPTISPMAKMCGMDDERAPEHADPLGHMDREAVLGLLAKHLSEAWASFDRPRPAEPQLRDELRERLSTPLPDQPGDAGAALDDATDVLDASVSPSRPLFTAYIGSTGLEAGVLAGALGIAYDVNLAASAGAVELLEDQALRWMAEFVGYPLRQGVFTSGGMTSNLSALLAARERALPGARASGVGGRSAGVYCSMESHHSVVRAVEVAGLGSDAVRRIELDERRRMRPDALAEALAADVARDVVPVAVVATAGTTLTGAVDPLEAIADVCGEHGVWLHVDGAYGVPAAGVPSTGPLFAGLDRADSVTVDAHKWMGVQKSCSIVMLRHAGALGSAFAHQEQYMLHMEDLANPVDNTLEYSRPVRSLKLWLAFRTYGAAAYRRWIEQTLQLARDLTAALREHPDFELLHEPQLSTVCFRHRPEGFADLDEHNLRLAAAVMRDGRVYLAPALLAGHCCLRVCFTNFRTRPEHVRELVRVLDDVAATVS